MSSSEPPDEDRYLAAMRERERAAAVARLRVILFFLILSTLFCCFLSYCYPPGY